MQPPEGKKFYGSITVSKRGQVVLPAEAREDFKIKAGDKLLVFGDMQAGMWIATIDIIRAMDVMKPFRELVLEEEAGESKDSSREDDGL